MKKKMVKFWKNRAENETKRGNKCQWHLFYLKALELVNDNTHRMVFALGRSVFFSFLSPLEWSVSLCAVYFFLSVHYQAPLMSLGFGTISLTRSILVVCLFFFAGYSKTACHFAFGARHISPNLQNQLLAHQSTTHLCIRHLSFRETKRFTYTVVQSVYLTHNTVKSWILYGNLILWRSMIWVLKDKPLE